VNTLADLDPYFAVKHAVRDAALLELADLVHHVLLAEDRLLGADGAVANVLEGGDVGQDIRFATLRATKVVAGEESAQSRAKVTPTGLSEIYLCVTHIGGRGSGSR
jgi:hypothetical protein